MIGINGFKYDAFISFSSRDTKVATSIVEKLEAEGLKCFISSRDIKTSEDWAEKVVEALDASRMVVYLHTKNSNASVQIGREVQRAIDVKKKPFISYRLTDEEFKGSKAFFIQSLSWIDSLVDPFDNIDKLVQAVKDIRDGKNVDSVHQDIGSFSLIFHRFGRIISLFAVTAIIITTGVLLYIEARHKADSKAEQAIAEYNAIVSTIDNPDLIDDSPLKAFEMLERLDSIASIFNGTRYSPNFTFDIQQKEEEYNVRLESAEIDLVEVICSYYEGYKVAPVEQIKNHIDNNIRKVLEIDMLLGKEPDERVLAIMGELD